MRDLGWLSEVVCLDDPNASFLGTDSFPIHALGMGCSPIGYNRRLIPWLNENLRIYNAVIVHGIWQWHSFATWFAIWLRRKKGLPSPAYFVMPHGMLDPWFQRAKSRRLKAIRNWFYWMLLEHRVIRDAKAILFTCDEELRLARTTFENYQPQREVKVGLGVEKPPAKTQEMTQAFHHSLPTLDPQAPYFLFLSRIHPKKGVDLLIKAYAAIIADRLDLQSENREGDNVSSFPALVIAGPVLESSYGEHIKDLAADLCPPNTVFFPGMLQGNAKWGALYGCDAFVLPSHQENFGIAVVEALACNRPVLISNQVNIWREIESSQGGLVAEDTPDGTSKLLRQWLQMTAEEKSTIEPRVCFQKHFEIRGAAENLSKTLKEYD
jgi:glycosyltransferase involved in cell wall biosynthesis